MSSPADEGASSVRTTSVRSATIANSSRSDGGSQSMTKTPYPSAVRYGTSVLPAFPYPSVTAMRLIFPAKSQPRLTVAAGLRR